MEKKRILWNSFYEINITWILKPHKYITKKGKKFFFSSQNPKTLNQNGPQQVNEYKKLWYTLKMEHFSAKKKVYSCNKMGES